MKRVATACALALGLAVFGGAADVAAQQALNPVGEFTYSLEIEGMAMGGSFVISGDEGDWTGMISSEMGEMPMSGIEVDGNKLLFSVDVPEAFVSFILEFDGEDFVGQFAADGMGQGAIAGSRR